MIILTMTMFTINDAGSPISWYPHCACTYIYWTAFMPPDQALQVVSLECPADICEADRNSVVAVAGVDNTSLLLQVRAGAAHVKGTAG